MEETATAGANTSQQQADINQNWRANRQNTTGQDNAAAPTPQARYRRPKTQEPVPDDLTSTLIHALRTPPYPDCPICFSSIHPSQPVWSCSPSIPVITIGPDVAAQYCWTTFHMKCIRAWAGKSVREVQDAWRARGEERGGEWRCPGCQGKREEVPNDYWCFCGAMPEPKPPRLATPHSCGNPCSRVRESGCGHACPLTCHPGPCPPCQVTTQLHCYCPRQKPLMIRCGVDQGQGRDLSCGEPCQRMLACGKHKCEKPCHKGSCDSCAVVDQAKCWCGKVEKEVGCGVGEEVVSITINPNGQEERWSGRFSCDNICDRYVDHSQPFRLWHPPLPPVMPHPLHHALRVLPACGHACPAKCHTGPCPPCTVPMVRPCRCGAITRSIACFELYVQGEGDGAHEEREILCERPCMALRACGKHECRRYKARRRGVGTSGEEEGPGGLHECDLCEERDHKGPCPPCLRSSFEELICACGQTVLEPPVPCGTRIACNYPCQREPPCGHPRTPHTCHGDDLPCPPCPSLTTRPCACGKKTVGNVKCSLTADKISCGSACGKLLACGFHHCEKLCHSGDCGACVLPCGKARKLCLPNTHPCTHPCHAPSACPEDTPCAASVTLTCPCGRLTQTARCGRSTVHPTRTHPALKCGPECRVAQRNARLAEALGISDDGAKGKGVVYPEEVMGFARANARFLSVVERAFKEFVEGEKRTQVLPHMPPERRKFVHDLASVYRMDTQMVDQEPHRSVQLIRRIDTRVPAPLLSTHIASSAPPPSLGKLADLKSGAWRLGARLRRSKGPAGTALGTRHPGAGWDANSDSECGRGDTAQEGPVADNWEDDV
ncbi:hypothetical protein BD779DRAFT_1613762 [Infundibulicybe gibba]|nr:hypothetical protein BD779DRAFT_1613762 [Infundibulicybe gibba]